MFPRALDGAFLDLDTHGAPLHVGWTVRLEGPAPSLGGLRRAEVNLPLTADQFEELWPLVQRSIEKDRALHELEGGTAEVDVYHGKLAGLVVVEVEFPSEADAQAFTPPAWFGAEVTEDPRFRNVSLAVADEPPRLG